MIADVVRLRQGRRPGTVPDKSQPAPVLRPVCEDDTEFLIRLYATTRSEEQALFGWDDARWDGFIRMQFTLQHTHYQQNYHNASFDLILLDEKPVGRLYVSRGTEEFRIIDISMLPECRGKGIGRKLLEALNREADQAGVPVTLHVEKHNPALNLYERLGFTVTEDRGFQWFMTRNCGDCNPSCPPLN
jgi:ribosomal protein S18 acetylase RimI-like enzyme